MRIGRRAAGLVGAALLAQIVSGGLCPARANDSNPQACNHLCHWWLGTAVPTEPGPQGVVASAPAPTGSPGNAGRARRLSRASTAVPSKVPLPRKRPTAEETASLLRVLPGEPVPGVTRDMPKAEAKSLCPDPGGCAIAPPDLRPVLSWSLRFESAASSLVVDAVDRGADASLDLLSRFD